MNQRPFSSPPMWITVFGLGSMRPASGTWGSLPPVIVAAALIALGQNESHNPLLYRSVLAAIFLVFCIACIAQGQRAEAYFGRKDPSNAVADETAGQCLSLVFLPAAATNTWPHAAFTLLLAFVSFRIMDIIKPWPARGLQRIPGGWGILIDDLFAGLYAAGVVQVFSRVMWP